MTAEPAAIVSAQVIAAGKGSVNVFEGLSFDLLHGSLTALAGPNGSGKTTLLDAVLGLVSVRAGALQVLGEKPGARQRAIGYVPQKNELPHDAQLIGYEFVAAAYRGDHWGVPLRLQRARYAVEEALEQVEATTLARRRLANLSGGQQQRLLIAQALVNRPQLLLLDEPLAHLDPAAQMQIVDLIARLSRERQLTILFSTHDINPLLGIMNSVLYLAGGSGRIGSVDEVVTDAALSELYGVPMHVIRDQGRLFVIQANAALQPPPAEAWVRRSWRQA